MGKMSLSPPPNATTHPIMKVQWVARAMTTPTLLLTKLARHNRALATTTMGATAVTIAATMPLEVAATPATTVGGEGTDPVPDPPSMVDAAMVGTVATTGPTTTAVTVATIAAATTTRIVVAIAATTVTTTGNGGSLMTPQPIGAVTQTHGTVSTK